MSQTNGQCVRGDCWVSPVVSWIRASFCVGRYVPRATYTILGFRCIWTSAHRVNTNP